MSFLKPSVFVKLFLIFCAISAATLLNSCKQLASFDPGVDGARVVTNKTFSAPTGLTATQGRKQKITLEWIPVSGARYYDIYSAESATAEFKKIGETAKNSFDDKVSAGKTLYYKVCAVKSNYTQSEFSATVKGTSLAQPIISGGNVDESSATISWFMENSRSMNGENNYEDQLSFEVFCERGGEIKSTTLYASDLNYDYKYTFAGLAGATNYQFYIRAYNYVFDQQNYEESAKVNNATLTSYMPLAPKFNASEGESAKGIRLYITLPEMVMVNTVTKSSPNEKVDEPYPLYFKIYRKVAEGSGDFTENDFVSDLYYNGSTEPPAVADYSDSNKGYKAGDTIEWFDDEAKLQGGVKYEYMIRSYPDKNYDTVVCPENTGGTGTVGAGNNGTTLEKATTAIGWKSAHPNFKVKSGDDVVKTFRKDEAGNNVEVLSYEFGFSAEWNDLGKAGDYRFAIKQNRKPLDAKESDSGTDSWLENKKDGNIFFDTLDEINSHLVKFGSESGLSDGEKGVYSYTLYIVPKTETEIDESKVLDNVEALDTIQVTEDVNLPKASLDVEDGYTNKVVLKISSFDENDADVTYKITRTILEGSGTGHDFDNLDGLHKSSDGVYEDTTVQGNCRYSYVLTATNPSGAWAKSQSKEAETLGKPDDVSFNREALAYDSIEISFYGVLAAKEYTVTLGESGGFGGGKTYSFAADGTGAPEDTEVKLNVNKFTVIIDKPEGYNDAEKAGISVDAVVMAESGVDNASGSVPVNVLGPALLEAKVDSSKTTDESISLTWKAVEGAKGYLIKRVMYSDAAMTKVAEGSDVTYYYEVESKKVTVDGEDVGDRCKVAADASLTLTDTYMEKSGDNVDLEVYHEAQAKIAWGLPFRYVVLPVLKSDNFSFEGLKLAEGGEVAYTNLAPTAATATWGYGLNLVADKATSGNKQGAKWEKPHVDKAGETAYTATKPVVYRRVAGEPGKFTMVNASNLKPNDDAASLEISGNDCYEAYEYVIKYCLADNAYPPSGIELPPSLLAEIKKNTQDYATPTGVKTELDNKGYLLTLGGFDARVSEKTYYEQISWNIWEYDKRAVGPDSMIIRVQNNNIDADFHDLVTIEKANVSNSAAIKEPADDINAIGVDGRTTAVLVAPKGIVAGTKYTTDGYLKVLRDYKHNYTFKLVRNDGEKDIPVFYEDYIGKENSIKTAYRQITNEEMVRAATLAMSIGFKHAWDDRPYTAGSPNDKWSAAQSAGSYTEPNSGLGSGKVTFNSYKDRSTSIFGTPNGDVYHKITYENYKPEMTAKSGAKVTFLTIDAQNDNDLFGETWGKLAIEPPSEYHSRGKSMDTQNFITVTGPSETNGLYSAKMAFFWLGTEKEPRENGQKGIKILHPSGNSEKIFGNITPLPFKSDGSAGAGFKQDAAEWQ